MRLPEISDSDIQEAEACWRLPRFLDTERRNILRSTETVDIRACPGSGKTTLLAIKLGIIASRWGYKHRGICVLSHTNAARREIETRFRNVPSLNELAAYPHFVGTIQSFLHAFLSTPGAIQKFRARPMIADSGQYQIEARKQFIDGSKRGGPYFTANISIREWIRENPNYDWPSDYASRHLQYQDESLSLPDLGTSKLSVAWTTKTGQELTHFKQRLSEQGIFSYQDMSALAAWYLKEHPPIVTAFQERFPLVFFDEMQDTVFEQGQLLDFLFSKTTVMQRFGDDRQAIYQSVSDDTSGAQFPRGSQLPMRASFRLSPSIAHLAEHVCADNPPEHLIGDETKPDRKHTIFVFKHACIENVLPAFCQLVIDEVATGLDSTQVKAVGANSKPKAELNKCPSAIGDYWHEFTPKSEQPQMRLTSLSGYLEKAKSEMMRTKNTGECRSLLLEGCSKMLRWQGLTYEGRPLSSKAMLTQLKESNPENYQKFNTLLARTCQSLLGSNLPDVSAFADEVHGLFESLSSPPWNSHVQEFIGAANGDGSSSADENLSLRENNIFTYHSEEGSVSVKVDTIHSVKGETLRAVLVLETIYHEHDLRVLVNKGYLKGQPTSDIPGKRLKEHLKRIYVAMTRPTDLLCFAILDDHLSKSDRETLEAHGWNLVEIG